MTAQTPRALESDYTHALHAKACYEAAQRRVVLDRVHVQVKRGPVVYCAIIKWPWTTPTGVDCWTVDTSWPEKACITVPCRNVILCPASGCSCRPAGPVAGELSACEVRGPLAPNPLPNSGVLA